VPDWWIFGPPPWSRADWLSLGQLIFTVAGFGAAIWQLRRTATAAEETTTAVNSLHVRFLVNDLLLALPRLHKLEDDIDSAIKSNSVNRVEQELVSYSRTASEISALLESRSETNDEELIKLLGQAGRASTKAKALLVSGSTDPVVTVVQPALTKIAAVSAAASALIVKLQRKAQES
jgi:hypothetical protein